MLAASITSRSTAKGVQPQILRHPSIPTRLDVATPFSSTPNLTPQKPPEDANSEQNSCGTWTRVIALPQTTWYLERRCRKTVVGTATPKVVCRKAREEVLLPRNEAVQKAKIANTQSEKSLRYDNATSELHPGEEFASMMRRLSCCAL